MHEIGYDVAALDYPWSDRVLEDLATGQLDLAIYNKARADSFSRAIRPVPLIHIIPGFGYSMGGGQFYVLSRSGLRRDIALDEIRNSIRGAQVLVQHGCDIHDNLLNVLDTTVAGALEQGIRLIDHPPSVGLEALGTLSDGLLVGGQNPRAQALYRGGYEEMLNASRLPERVRVIIGQRSENCLVFGARVCKSFSHIQREAIARALWDNFQAAWNAPDQFEINLRRLAESVQGQCASYVEAEFVVRYILFHTYRFGRPDEKGMGRLQ